MAQAAQPFDAATVTRLHNTVKYGEVKRGQSATRRAVVADIIRSQNFLLTETDSRAELRYEDGSIVRVGQNTVFTFEANTRTLALEKGSFIFFVPKGAGGGTIKTPSLTAAITGTVGKVSVNTIAVLEGELTLLPSGRKIPAGYFVRRNADGSITISRFDWTKALDGQLMVFNGPMPGFSRWDRMAGAPGPRLEFAALSQIESMERALNHPSGVRHFFPAPKAPPADRQRTRVAVPPPRNPSPRPPTDPGGHHNGNGNGRQPY